MIDYELLGGLLGSAWHDQHDYPANYTDRIRVAHLLLNTIGIEDIVPQQQFLMALLNTMQGKCYNCGMETDNRWSVGVYCCPACAVNKPGVVSRRD